ALGMSHLTPMVLNWYPTNPALRTPSRTLKFRSNRCILHGFPVYHTYKHTHTQTLILISTTALLDLRESHTDEIPICALFMSSGFNPVAYTMPRTRISGFHIRENI